MKKYNVVVSTDIGSFIINRNDLGVGWQLSTYGTYDPNELNAIKELFKILRKSSSNLVALDIGANIGVHSVILAEQVGSEGRVYAFEAQRIVFNMLAGNIALNSIQNVICFHNAVSDRSEFIDIPIFDYGKPMSIGSVEFDGTQKEFIGQTPTIGEPERVACVAIDELNLNQLNFMKIDVEGMEVKVLAGAKNTITKFRPIMLVEYLKSDQDKIISFLRDVNYVLYTGIGANYLCIPSESGITISDLPLVA